MSCAVRKVLVLAIVITSASITNAQEAPAVDVTDPTAVARAYVDACRQGDAKTALQVLHPDDPLRKMMGEIAEAIGREVEETQIDFEAMWTEYLFLPARMGLGQELTDAQQDADAAQVTFRRNWELDQKIVLAKLDDGTWRVKAVASIEATRGGESFLAKQLAARQSGSSEAGVSSPARIYQSQSRLRFLWSAMDEYADEHDNRLPPADQWVDELEPYILDREMFRCPAAPEQEYGYAMNVLASEQEVPQDWNARRGLIVLFEWPNAQRNSAAMPDDLAEAESFWPDGRIAYITADSNTGALPKGFAFADLRLADDLGNQCSSHLHTLAKAARKYAREHDGLLPGADTWQDDLALYLLEAGGGEEVFACPAAPELETAYAINRAIAGKNAMELTDHDDTILFFESDLNVPNAAGDPEQDAPQVRRHLTEWDARKMNKVVYLNGSIGSQYSEKPEEAIRG